MKDLKILSEMSPGLDLPWLRWEGQISVYHNLDSAFPNSSMYYVCQRLCQTISVNPSNKFVMVISFFNVSAFVIDCTEIFYSWNILLYLFILAIRFAQRFCKWYRLVCTWPDCFCSTMIEMSCCSCFISWQSSIKLRMITLYTHFN